ncbi:secreted protein [Salisediminibacterium halotolerans]|uniref:molybdopterin-dependent oxidoreductase n=1 Tax=Salisediminibacterium halotolerans TaxID=517425 RepID=UPI000EB27E4A|nr:molybdopterin-dependent oxidoreductase [Salisediminibacterium halotolerans]RLJ69257.1 secreted protein [Actinophytocola xinjiangensis]RPE87008.1 secreted protein [Salisediminibacterium halotolerans]TWG32259.1 secreted protein [Salisediminibacterium halotolerans]GEL08002.1 dehydrogenase [Salisediminibacterium halotolerans]
MKLSRRNFLKASAVTGLFAAGASQKGPVMNAFSTAANAEEENVEQGEWIPSVCQGCTAWCAVEIYRIDGRATKVRGNPNAKANHGHSCVRSHLGLQQVYDPDRVKQPMKRTNPNKGRDEDPEFVPISWEEAMDTIAEKIMELRENDETHKFSVWRGRYTSLNGILYGNMPKIIGSPNNISHSSICAESEKFGRYYTERYWGYADYDHENTLYEIFWGGDPISTNRQVPHTASIWGDLKSRATLACIDPRLSTTAAKSDEWLPVMPGEDGALASAIAHVLLTEELWHKPFVGDFTNGENQFVAGQEVDEDDFEEIQTHGLVKWWNLVLKDATPEWAAERSGIPEDQIYRVARGFGKAAPRAISFSSPGSSMTIRGGYTALAQAALNGLVGSADAEGGVISNGIDVPTNDWPEIDDYLDDIAEAGLERERVDHGGRLELPALKDSESGGVKPTNTVADAMLNEDPYNLKVVMSYWNNFNFSNQGTERWDEALAKLPFMVHMTVNPAEQTHYADIVLPVPHSMFERLSPVDGSNGNLHRHLHMQNKVIESPFDIRVDETEIPWMLGEALEEKGFSNLIDYFRNEFRDPETGDAPTNAEEFNLIATKQYTEPIWDPSFEKDGDTINGWEELLEVGTWNTAKYEFRQKWDGNWGTETGQFEFYSETLKKALEEHADKHDASVDEVMEACNLEARGELAYVPHYEPAMRVGDEDEYPFIFTEHRSKLNREARSANTSWYQAFKDVDIGDEAWDDVAKINPKDADELGIEDGDEVKLTTETGSITVKAKRWEGTRPGVISKCYGQGHWAYGHIASLDRENQIARGGNNNDILAPVHEALSGSGARHGGQTRVRIDKV